MSILSRLRLTASSGSVIGALALTNAALLVHVFFGDRLRRLAQRLVSRSADACDEPLEQLLGRDYVPPLPGPVAAALDRSCLCFLATAAKDAPHLSLMRFTYCAGLAAPNTEVMVMSTRRNTKKYAMLTENENVALLVHDFAADASADMTNYEEVEGRSKFSITLNGTVRVENGALAERYRRIHLARNSTYGQFIVGDDIAIVTVSLRSARVCDVNDSVRHWARGGDRGEAWTEVTAGPK